MLGNPGPQSGSTIGHEGLRWAKVPSVANDAHLGPCKLDGGSQEMQDRGVYVAYAWSACLTIAPPSR